MGRYGRSTAPNVVFPFELSLIAARDIHSLSAVIEEVSGRLQANSGAALAQWSGPEARVFAANVASWRQSAGSVIAALQYLADELARAWAAARGEQDRINFARWVDHEIDNDNWAENAWEWLVGENSYGKGPDDPPVPRASVYEPTRSPQYPRFGP